MKSKKVCNKCKEELPVELFNKDKTKADGLQTICKNCNKQYREANKEKIADYKKQYYEANKEIITEKSKQYREANKEKLADYKKQCYEANKEIITEKSKQYYEANKEIITEKSKQYYEANKEKLADYKKQYREANKEKLAEKKKQYYEANKEKIADYYEANKEKIAEKKKQHYEANKEIITERNKQYREANKEKLAEKSKQYYEANKEKLAEKSKQYREANKEKIADYQKQYKKQWNIRLHNNISTALSNSLKTTGKFKTTFKYLGCTKEVFIKYLESKFDKNMNWDNYGEWHIDHIIPISLIDSSNEIEVMYIWHYTNLQPMWCSDNISKGNKIDLKYNNFTKFIDLKMKSFNTNNYNLKTHNFEIPNRTIK